MEMHRFTLEPFESRETGTRIRQRVQRREEVRAQTGSMGSVYRQTALCALIVALLIVLELFVFRKEPEAVPASAPTAVPETKAAAADTQEEEDEESLGKLQFVSGRVYSVFSSDARWTLPLTPEEMETSADGKLLSLRADAGTAVRAAAAGQVVSIGRDPELGTMVRIYHGADCESVYYCLGGVSVEEGQPLLAGDTVGVVGEEGVLCVAALENGEPTAVSDRFDMKLPMLT